MQARTLLFTAPREVRITQVTLPDPAPEQLVVRTLWSGISSGTELLAYRGELDADTVLDETLPGLGGSFRYPFSYGYSCVGRVERGIETVPEGTVVFAFCPHQDMFVAAERDVIPLAASTDTRAATLFPLVETALQLTLDAGAVLDQTVVVLGQGAVGVLTALLLARAGARVLSAEPRVWRREIATSLGIDCVAPDELMHRVSDASNGRGAPLLVELSGSPLALADGLRLLAHEGTALVGSWYGTRPVTLRLGADFHRRRLTIRSSQVSTIPAALQDTWDIQRRRAAARGLLDELPLETLATSEFAFERAADAFAALDDGKPGLVHAALRYV
jgi:2-desacetyl-2-hydroxyethyl bacteriochlorophyllide A dehydrogenase